MVDFVIGGHSHAYALGLPSDYADAPTRVININTELDGVVGGWPRPDDYWDVLAEAGADRSIILSWFGNDPVARYVFAGKPPFDFVLGSCPDKELLAEHAIVPEALIRDTYSIYDKPLLDLLVKLKAKAKQVFLLSPPPPKGTSEAALALMRTEQYFVDAAELAGGFAALPLTDVRVLKKLWLLMCDMQVECAHRASAKFIPFPAGAMTDEGLLAVEYWNHDFTHANHACGQILFKEIQHAI